MPGRVEKHAPPNVRLRIDLDGAQAHRPCRRLARYFGTTDRFWLNLQTRYDLELVKADLGGALEQIQPLQSA